MHFGVKKTFNSINFVFLLKSLKKFEIAITNLRLVSVTQQSSATLSRNKFAQAICQTNIASSDTDDDIIVSSILLIVSMHY